MKARLIAFYLPQYHPIPENDEWWGKDFTDWKNVKKTKPLFWGHNQPHKPADLGYYDLRQPEVREAQAELAKKFKIYGFCYYHYWFLGRRILNRPFDEVFTSGKPDFPFSLCWANENWSRRWDGSDQEILIEQKYSEQDDINHIQHLIPIFKDKRYIKIQGKPFFLVYRGDKIPNPLKTTSLWRKIAEASGLPGLYLCKAEAFGSKGNPRDLGFDASVEFPPHEVNHKLRLTPGFLQKAADKLGLSKKPYEDHEIFDYSEIADDMLRRKKPCYKFFPCVIPAWDNSARRKKNAIIIKDSTPKAYYKWLKASIEKFNTPIEDENIIFINAWNEWAESAYLEPDKKYGGAYLEATKRALEDCK